MKQWKMTSADFYQLLEMQEYKCNLTGLPLTPDNTALIHKTPLRSGGKHEFSNVQLVHSIIAKLARDIGPSELLNLCKLVIKQLDT